MNRLPHPIGKWCFDQILPLLKNQPTSCGLGLQPPFGIALPASANSLLLASCFWADRPGFPFLGVSVCPQFLFLTPLAQGGSVF